MRREICFKNLKVEFLQDESDQFFQRTPMNFAIVKFNKRNDRLDIVSAFGYMVQID